jgi:hypothetical protein
MSVVGRRGRGGHREAQRDGRCQDHRWRRVSGPYGHGHVGRFVSPAWSWVATESVVQLLGDKSGLTVSRYCAWSCHLSCMNVFRVRTLVIWPRVSGHLERCVWYCRWLWIQISSMIYRI